MPSIESYQMLLAAAAACEDKKAEDVRILALDPAESGLADYFLICNGTNDRQNVAITDEIEIRLKREFATYPNSVEGRRQGEWVLMDYVDFIVHVFSPEKRAYYGLERLRKSATSMSIDDLSSELKAAITSARERKPIKEKRSTNANSTKDVVSTRSIKLPKVAASAPKSRAKTAPETEKTSVKRTGVKKQEAASKRVGSGSARVPAKGVSR